MKQIYISHTKNDRHHVYKLREYLQKSGYRVRFNQKLAQGKRWEFELVDTILSSDVVVPIITDAAAESADVTYEWSLAMGAGVTVFPIVFRGVNPHPHLMILPMYDFSAYTDEDDAWRQFMRELQRTLGDKVTMPGDYDQEPNFTTQDLDAIGTRQSNKDTGFYLIVQQNNKPRQEYRLEGSSVSLGREPKNDIVIQEHGVSRAHLRFIRVDSGYKVLDMGSTNGTYNADGDRIDTMILSPGDVLTIGDNVTLTYRYVGG